MKTTLIAITLSLFFSTAKAFDYPEKKEVMKAEIACRDEKSLFPTVVKLDRNASLKLLSFLESINDQWVSWGFITPPAGDIQITFWLSDQRSVLVQTWFDFEKVGIDAGYRKLSHNEAKAFQMLLPACKN